MKSRFLLTLFMTLSCLPIIATGAVFTVSDLVAYNPSAIGDDLTFGPDGRLYSSPYNAWLYAVSVEDGSVELYGTSLNNSLGSVFKPDGSLFVANLGNSDVEIIPPGGGIALPYANMAGGTSGLCANASRDTLWVAHYYLDYISKLPMTGAGPQIFVSGGHLNGPVGVFMDDDGYLWVGNYDDPKIIKYAPDGTETLVVTLPIVTGGIGYICWDGGAWIYATSIMEQQVYRVSMDGEYEVVAGTGAVGHDNGPGDQATFSQPNGMEYDRENDILYVSEFGNRAIRKIEIQEVTAVEEGLESPGRVLELGQNNPNPFNPTTRIDYEIKRAGQARLEIFDAAGRRLRTLLDSFQAAGRGTLTWDGRDEAGGTLPSGVYLYRLSAAGEVASRRMLLLK